METENTNEEETPQPVSLTTNPPGLLNSSLLPDHEYQLTITKSGNRIALKVHFIKYSNPPTDEDDLGELYEKVNYTSDYAPYLFIEAPSTYSYGMFRIMETLSLDEVTSNFREDFATSKLAMQIEREENMLHSSRDEYNTFGWFFYPGNLIWILLSPTNDVIVTELPRYEEPDSTVDSFVTKFPDYPEFKNFLDTYVAQLSPVEYRNYLACVSPLYFTRLAPLEYSFSMVETSILHKPRPFYHAMLYIFSKIPHFSPSITSEGPNKLSEHSYFIYLNRLIYYYNLYINLSNGLLNGFENSAVVAVMLHGGYDTFDEIIDISSWGNLKNVFICTKSTPGLFSYHCKDDRVSKSYASKGNLFDKMFYSVNNYKALSFDEINNQIYQFNKSSVAANCRIINKRMGGAMEHYIIPKTNEYIEKIYSTKLEEGEEFFTNNNDSIIDIQAFGSLDDSMDAQTRLRNSNLLLNRDFIESLGPSRMSTIIIQDQRVKSASIFLGDIIHYYSTLGKENIFIYDTSCGFDTKTDPKKFIGEMDYSSRGALSFKDPFYFTRFKNKMDLITKSLAVKGFGRKKNKSRGKKLNCSSKKNKTHSLCKHNSTRKRKRHILSIKKSTRKRTR